MIEKISINKIKSNPNNPRVIKDDKFYKLLGSIRDFPEMLDLRPIIVDEDNMILAGNMRYKAVQNLGWKEVPVIKASNLSDEQKKEFIIKDNVSFGSWDWDMIANEWDSIELDDWGLDTPAFAPDVDYSILDDDDDGSISDAIDTMEKGVKKAIQIEFEPEHYDDAFELVKFWREQKLYIGGFLIEKLKAEKEKL